MTREVDVAIIGGGIVGLAHAMMACRMRRRVVLLERSPAAEGASVRNFGMIWPIGQPDGPLLETALRSRERWLDLAASGVVPVEACGSIHLAHRPDELAVLEEFADRGTHEARLMKPEEVLDLQPMANADGLLGGMFSGTELRVDPRTASARIAAWLGEDASVECRFGTPVVEAGDGLVVASDGARWRAERIVLCSGSDLLSLLPEVFRTSGLVPCKLQMLGASFDPAGGRRALPHLAGGLTLRHYRAFEGCPTLPALRSRIADETPELDRFGIHVMASAFPDGRLILGDSHEYGDAISPFDRPEIDDLMLRELRRIVRLDDWTIRERWHGIYAKHPTDPVFRTTARGNVEVFVGTGGAGMTLAFGLAEQAWESWDRIS